MAKVPAPWALTPNVSISFWCPGKLQRGGGGWIWAPRGLRSRVKALHAYLNPWSRPSWQVVGQSRHPGHLASGLAGQDDLVHSGQGRCLVSCDPKHIQCPILTPEAQAAVATGTLLGQSQVPRQMV